MQSFTSPRPRLCHMAQGPQWNTFCHRHCWFGSRHREWQPAPGGGDRIGDGEESVTLLVVIASAGSSRSHPRARRLGGDPDVVGSRNLLTGEPHRPHDPTGVVRGFPRVLADYTRCGHLWGADVIRSVTDGAP